MNTNIAVISDIHGNYVSLLNIINDALNNGVTEFLFLGDFVTDSYRGNEIISLIKSLKSTCVKGNRESYILNHNEMDEDFNKRINRKALGYESLSKETLEFLSHLPEVQRIFIGNKKVLLIHGSDFYYSKMKLIDYYEKLLYRYPDIDIFMFGHTHKKH